MARSSLDGGGRRAGRPRRPVLSRDRIVDAALALIDDAGGDGFSLTRLAARLSVKPSSFYNHVSGRDEILAGVQERITATIDTSMLTGLPWRTAVTEWAWSYRAALAAHPHAIALFAVMPVRGAARTLQMYERLVLVFEGAGWPAAEVIPAVVAIESFILGSALDAGAPPAQFAAGPDARTVPRFAAAVAARDRTLRRSGTAAADAAFAVGLEALLDGLERAPDRGA